MHRQCALGAAAAAPACLHRAYTASTAAVRVRNTSCTRRRAEYKLYAPCMPGGKHCTPPVYAPRAGGGEGGSGGAPAAGAGAAASCEPSPPPLPSSPSPPPREGHTLYVRPCMRLEPGNVRHQCYAAAARAEAAWWCSTSGLRVAAGALCRSRCASALRCWAAAFSVRAHWAVCVPGWHERRRWRSASVQRVS